jgi:DNA invertase Pin-like site-specific DNA recombinase
MTRPLRAVLYARCSSQKQADRDLSVPAQLDHCRQHALRRDWHVVGEYHDDGISGFEDERRPAFRRMMADMVQDKRPFDVIVVWDFSRFSRSLEHSLRIMQELRGAGVQLESTKEQTDDSPAGWLMGTVFRSFNEFQVRKLAEDTRRGMRKNASDGGWNGGSLPIGYLVERPQGGRGPGRLVPDPRWGPLVTRMFRMALSGQGACSIAATFNEEGLLTLRGRRWSKQTVLYILRNEVYTGVYVWGVSQNGKFANTPMEELRIEGAHEALVSAEDYARVQAAIELRRPDVTHPRTSAGEYLLSGLLMCSACGGPYIGHGARNGTYHYYTCQTKMKQGAEACPDARNFERTKVEGVVVDVLRAGALHPGVFGELIREVQASLGASQHKAREERLVLEGQVAEVDRRLTKLYEAVESGSIPAARLAPRIEQVSGEKDELERRLAELPSGEVEPLLLIGDEDIESWVEDLRAVVDLGTVDERRALLRSWVQRVVATGDELTVEYTFPLVPVGSAEGAGGVGGGPDGGGRGAKVPGTRVPVNSRRRDGSAGTDKSKKGETAVRRFLPTVRNGSPSETHGAQSGGRIGQSSGSV